MTAVAEAYAARTVALADALTDEWDLVRCADHDVAHHADDPCPTCDEETEPPGVVYAVCAQCPTPLEYDDMRWCSQSCRDEDYREQRAEQTGDL